MQKCFVASQEYRIYLQFANMLIYPQDFQRKVSFEAVCFDLPQARHESENEGKKIKMVNKRAQIPKLSIPLITKARSSLF